MPRGIVNQNSEMYAGTKFSASQDAETLQEHISILSKSNRNIAADVDHLETFNPRSAYDSFAEESAVIVEEAQAMTGAHITPEGIRNKIRTDIEELAEELQEEAESTSEAYKERHAAAMDKLEKAIHKQENLSSSEIAHLSLRNSELQGEIRGKLYGLNTVRDLEFEFKRLSDESAHDKTLARFLSKNYYLFLDRVKELDPGETEKTRANFAIMQAAERVKRNGYSEKEMAILAVRDHLGKRDFSTKAAKRNIEQQKRALLNKYK